MKKIKEYIKLMRPKHYLKNFLIFLPLIFGNMLFEGNLLFKCILGYIAFCFIASSVYIINDINDVEKDRKHFKKKNRPIAKGTVSVREAICLLIFLITISIFLVVIFMDNPLIVLSYLLIYLGMNVAYSFGLKNYPIVDICILVFGFILRVLYGSCIVDISVSNWLYLTVMALSFYLSLGKRRNEIIKVSSKNTRGVLKYYNKEFLDKNMYMCLSMAIVFYSLWASSPDISKSNDMLLYTVPVVILICMKYSMIIESDSDGDPIEVVMDDKFLLLLIVLYAVLLMTCIYI